MLNVGAAWAIFGKNSPGPQHVDANIHVILWAFGMFNNVSVGHREKEQVKGDNLIKNSIALDAELCLCAIVKVNTLGLVDVDATAQLELLLNACG
ncbi:hypothetical protein Golax_006382 [Gossypium laxum]|uniref:Hydrophobic seed protein domain-containing protein n=1 Tax=Gossypium laxum TaxID=34288 RepID=A0A7J9A554_9ROSI|nr:hypothetical protein [Gossypium laxum]